MRFSTKAIHAGENQKLFQSAVMPPIYMTSTFEQGHPDDVYEYTRANNPNFTILENTLAPLEDAKYATVFSSGLGALTAYLSTLKAGDRVVAIEGLYGGTYRLFKNVFENFDLTLELVAYEDIHTLKKDLPSAELLIFETPTNPLLDIYDIKLLVDLAHKMNTICMVDNTFATPYVQNPLNFGADIVWHSTTKYIGGHSDTIGGVMMTNNHEIKEKLDFARKALGVNPSPFDCWLITRGVKTLALRMERHQKNAEKLAAFFQEQSYVKQVYYPGLSIHQGHEIALKQMRGFGGMLSLELDMTLDELKEWMSSLKYVKLAESLGGVESLISHPATMTHASIPKNERLRLGITDDLVRISVGVEDIEDLIEDFSNAASKVLHCSKF